jgi:hypothetical protein
LIQLDATPDGSSRGILAYSVQESGVSNLRWGKYNTSTSSLDPVSVVNVGFTGGVKLSRNGIYCCVFGSLNQNQTIRVFTPQGGTWPNFGSRTSVQVGANIVVPQTISGVQINNAGTRILAQSENLIYYYELSSGQWLLRSTFAPPLETSEIINRISINSDGSALVAATGSGFFTYTLSGTSWFQGNKFIVSNGGRIDIAGNSVWLALNTTAGVSIYKSTITQVTYDVPVITPGQSFAATENRAFTASLAMLVDGLNRQVTSWSATGLPSGLSINASTGIISGTPTVKGQFSASITATNPDGSDTETVQFTVESALPIFAGAIRATSVYAGAARATSLYYGSQKLWPL